VVSQAGKSWVSITAVLAPLPEFAMSGDGRRVAITLEHRPGDGTHSDLFVAVYETPSSERAGCEHKKKWKRRLARGGDFGYG
jgi:hypothetical protein